MTSKDCPVGAFNKTVKSTNVNSVVLWRNLMMNRCLIIETIARSTQLTIEINYHVEKRLASTSLYPNILIAPPGRLRILAVGPFGGLNWNPSAFHANCRHAKLLSWEALQAKVYPLRNKTKGESIRKFSVFTFVRVLHFSVFGFFFRIYTLNWLKYWFFRDIWVS